MPLEGAFYDQSVSYKQTRKGTQQKGRERRKELIEKKIYLKENKTKAKLDEKW